MCAHLLGTHVHPCCCLDLETQSECSTASQLIGSNMIYFPLTVLRAEIPLKISSRKKKEKGKRRHKKNIVMK